MELVRVAENAERDGLFFADYEFILVDEEKEVCRLSAKEIGKKKELNLMAFTKLGYQGKGYATCGLSMLTKWAAQNEYEQVSMTSLMNHEVTISIAAKLGFTRKNNSVWIKSLAGSLA